MNGVERSNDGVVLRKCPFCGGEAKLMTMNYETLEPVCYDEGFGKDVDTWVHCYGCDTDFCHSDVTTIPVNVEYWWNTRKPLERVIERLEVESNFFGGEPMGTLQKTYYCKGIERAIEIIKEEMMK